MTTPLLNQLLDEAVERCHELATQAQAAATAGAEVAEEALGLAQVVETEAQGLHGDITQAVEALQGAATRITDATDRAIASLDGVPGRASESAASVRAMLEALLGQVQALDGARQQLLDGVKTAGERLDQDATDLAAGVQAYLDRVKEAWTKPVTGMRQLVETSHELRLQVDERAALVRKDAEQLGKVALEQCDAFADGTVRGAQAIANHLTTTLNDARRRHNTEMAELRGGALDETESGVPDPNWIDNTLATLKAELTTLDPVPNQVEEVLFAPLSVITGTAERAEQHLATAAQSLDKAKP